MKMETNIVYQEDCIEGMKKIPSNSIDLVLTDPPYNLNKAEWDKEDIFNDKFIKELNRVIKESGSILVWCGIGEKSQSLIKWFPILSNYFYFKDLITWKKQKGFGMRKGYLYCREEVMWFVKNNNSFCWNKENQYLKNHTGSNISKEYMKRTGHGARITNVWTDISECAMRGNIKYKQGNGHLTPKPIEAISRIIKLHTKEDDIVLDCFGGSGTTAIACMETNRQYILFENNPQYFKIINDRIQSAKSQTLLSQPSAEGSLIGIKRKPCEVSQSLLRKPSLNSDIKTQW